MSLNLERYASALEHAQRHWSLRRQQAAHETTPALTIALEREAGTFGTSLARQLGQRLGWPVYDHELLEVIAQEMGLRVQLLESMDERRQSWLQEAFQSLAEVPQVSEDAYVHHLVQTILSLGAHGQCILVGRGAAQILPPASTLRIRLVGEWSDRVAQAAQRLGLSREQAARWIEETDRERIRFVREHFLRDPTDPHLYDLVLNASRWSVAEAVELLVQAVQCRQQRSAPASPAASGSAAER